jgi:bile acid:Na+ symporter, BASS family
MAYHNVRTLSTGVRNVGVSLVIATGSFPGTPAVTAALAFAIFQTVVLALVAVAWGRLRPSAARDEAA